MNKNPLGLNISEDCIYFETHDFDWNNPGIAYYDSSKKTIIHIDYQCKNCKAGLIDVYDNQTSYNMVFSYKTCNELIMEDIIK